MNVFNEYAQYYDLLYRDKDYAGEAKFVKKQLTRQGGKIGELLELGCGTGRHAVEFGRLGYKVTGVDMSYEMVAHAEMRAGSLDGKEKANLNFHVGDVRSVRLAGKFDTVVSLFHVISYQTSDDDLRSAFLTAAHHLKRGGLFLFDFWYGPAVLQDPPTVRVKRLEDDAIQVTRLAEPSHEASRNLVTVNYDIFLRNKLDRTLDEIRESHLMRYLFLPELQHLLEREGFVLRASGAWLSDKALAEDSWYGWLVAQLN